MYMSKAPRVQVDFVSLIIVSPEFTELLVTPTKRDGSAYDMFRFPGINACNVAPASLLSAILTQRVLSSDTADDGERVKRFVTSLRPLGANGQCNLSDFVFAIGNHRKLFVPCVLSDGASWDLYVRHDAVPHPSQPDVTLLPVRWISVNQMIAPNDSYEVPAAHYYAAGRLIDVLRQNGVHV